MRLEITNLTKRYKQQEALKEMSLVVLEGQCVGVLGDNGSGKSTLISIVAGMQQADSGSVRLDGKAISKEMRKYIAYVPQAPILLEDLSVQDNIKLWKSVYEDRVKEDNYIELSNILDIDSVLKKRVSALSGGMKKRVSVLIALMHEPKFLLMDEAFAALDAKTIESLVAYLSKHADMGIIYSSHNIEEILRLCDRVYILKEGRLVYETDIDASQAKESQIELLYKYF